MRITNNHVHSSYLASSWRTQVSYACFSLHSFLESGTEEYFYSVRPTKNAELVLPLCTDVLFTNCVMLIAYDEKNLVEIGGVDCGGAGCFLLAHCYVDFLGAEYDVHFH